MSNINDLSLTQLKRAVQIKEQISKLESELNSLVGSSGSTNKSNAGKSGMSASARAKIGAAMKARWAARKGSSNAKSKSKSSGSAKKPQMSAEARKRISEAAKARWAKAKAAGKKSL
jgi:hypothetical protein